MPTAKATKQTISKDVNTVPAEVEQAAVAKQKFGRFVKDPKIQESIISTLGDSARAKTFTAAIVSAIATNSNLMACDNLTILSAALLGESLNLSPSPQLGQYYIMPMGNKATFVLGWKGYFQLALRSGEYRKLNAVPIKEGELVKYNPIYEEYEFNYISDPAERLAAPTIGYYAFYETINGFRKEMYMTKAEMEAHANEFSKAYRSDKRNNSANSFWVRDFDGMALKTMYRMLIGKYGLMSIDLRTAYENDMSAGELDGEREYVDNPADEAIDV